MERATRRLAAVWFADIVGFTALSSRDEDAAVRLVRLLQDKAREVVSRHGGTIVKFTGDGLLAHHDSTTAAVDAATELAADFRAGSLALDEPALVRAGVHVGEVVVSEDGDLYGDGVNVAARLEQEARPGRIVVSEDVWRHCRQRPDLDFAAIGVLHLKGIGEPVWAYEVVDERSDGEPAGPPPGEAGRKLDEARSIAVLPLEVLGGGEEAEFLAAGLHNDLLTELSKVPELTVISRTSVMGYRGAEKPIPRIARELGVGTVVEGAVQAAGRRVRLTVQMIDGAHDVHRWAESYDRELTTENLFDIQSDLTRSIAESLHAELVPPHDGSEAGPPTADLDAYRLAAQGRQQFDLKTEDGFLRAIELFEQAIERDPDYADAWVGLADALALMKDYGYGDPEDLVVRAEAAAYRALALAPDSAGAHTSLALLLSTHQDGPATIREYETAIRLQPSYADAHNWHAWTSLLLGRGEVALESARRAVELNPLSAEPVTNLGLGYLATGEPEKALAEVRRAKELSPFTTADLYIGIALYDLDRLEEAREVLEPLAVRSAGELTVPWAKHGPDVTLGLVLARLGRVEEARDVLGTIHPDEHPFAHGLLRLGLGETDEAITHLARVEAMSAWPCLAYHHHYRDVWRRIGGTPAHGALLRVARRSWRLDPEGDE